MSERETLAGDARLAALAEERLRRIARTHPVTATWFGIHTQDDRLDAGTREAVEQEIADERASFAAFEAVDPATCSAVGRIERDLAIQTVRRALFDLEVHRVWERRSTAMDVMGDGLFLVLAREFAPLAARLTSLTSRLEAVPRLLDEHRTRLGPRPVRLWNELELQSARGMPALLGEIVAAGRGVLDQRAQQRLERAAWRAGAAVDAFTAWLREQLGHAVDDWPLGRERYDELLGRRAFDGLGADEILDIGHQQLAELKAARVATAREIDPDASEATVLDRIKSDGPPDFAAALEAYRETMWRARRHIVDRDLATIPPDERIEVRETPHFLRNVLPFAAYMEPPRFDEHPSGIYVVTPSVDGDPRAMREHSYASISNTSIHEAYPGHHLQLSCANRHPSLVRFLADAPEFVEGWGMYSEQMMREEGFDDAPRFRFNMYTDAIWRACRIVLDVRLHRGEIGVDEATDFLVGQTGFEGPQARAEVHRYTYTPTYQLSYLLGKVLILRLREEERRRLGPAFSLRRFHDQLLYAGSLPISFHRRLMREAPADAVAV
ncbi:MAG: hypothetical protein A2X23_07865 [Chloroflexi bacterium GWC2_73_18]|nr:MAG: hypothetical protein A2X23_07865 [Chloroflexi bacterium GWC2_73_18]